jgi:putative tricarboxylic transport membrane protein
VLSPILEQNFKRALQISYGDPTIFVRKPISLALLIAATAILMLVLLPVFRKGREVAFQEQD